MEKLWIPKKTSPGRSIVVVADWKKQSFAGLRGPWPSSSSQEKRLVDHLAKGLDLSILAGTAHSAFSQKLLAARPAGGKKSRARQIPHVRQWCGMFSGPLVPEGLRLRGIGGWTPYIGNRLGRDIGWRASPEPFGQDEHAWSHAHTAHPRRRASHRRGWHWGDQQCGSGWQRQLDCPTEGFEGVWWQRKGGC